MPGMELPGGTTWNTGAEIRASYQELIEDVVGATAMTRILDDTQREIEDRLRPHWDVDDTTYWSAANIITWAPGVKSFHKKLTAGRCYMEGVWGKNTLGTGRAAEFGTFLEESVWAAIKMLIDKGALKVPRRTSSPDGRTLLATNAGKSDPFFTMEDETLQPYTPPGGTRDDISYA